MKMQPHQGNVVYSIGSGSNGSSATVTVPYTITYDSLSHTIQKMSGKIDDVAHSVINAAYQAYLLLPVVENYEGPVYMNDRYYGSVDEAIDAIVDDGEHPAYAKAYPCTEDKAPTPVAEVLLDWIDEGWGEQFEDYEPTSFPADVRQAADNLLTMLHRLAPTVWNADMKHRIVLAVEDPDQEYDPEEDRYDD